MGLCVRVLGLACRIECLFHFSMFALQLQTSGTLARRCFLNRRADGRPSQEAAVHFPVEALLQTLLDMN